MPSFFSRAWQSPTLTTWSSFLVRSLGVVLLLPYLLVRLNPQQVALYLLFGVVASLRILADFGFSPTFIRLIAYTERERAEPNVNRPELAIGGTGEIVAAMRTIYLWMSFALAVLLGTVGTAAVAGQIQKLENPAEGWIGWSITLVCGIFGCWATQFLSFLQGLNRVALVRRWEALFSSLGLLTTLYVLSRGGGLWEVVFANQMWGVATGVRNWILTRRVENGIWLQHRKTRITRDALRQIWSPAWRTGIGTLTGFGIWQISGLVYAQVYSGATLASLMLGLRLMSLVSEFSYAPFSSKLPFICRLYALGKMPEFVLQLRRGMRWTYVAFLGSWIALGIAGPQILQSLQSKTPFPNPHFWAALGLSLLFHRFGAMHVHVSNSSNNVIMHIADGGASLIYFPAFLALIPVAGIYAMPLAQIGAYLGFYCWYSALHSYRSIKSNFVRFEQTVFLPALASAVVYVAVVFLVK